MKTILILGAAVLSLAMIAFTATTSFADYYNPNGTWHVTGGSQGKFTEQSRQNDGNGNPVAFTGTCDATSQTCWDVSGDGHTVHTYGVGAPTGPYTSVGGVNY